jgi:hypothetical protein
MSGENRWLVYCEPVKEKKKGWILKMKDPKLEENLVGLEINR